MPQFFLAYWKLAPLNFFIIRSTSRVVGSVSNLNDVKVSALTDQNSVSTEWSSGTPFQDIYFSKRLRGAR